MFETIGKTDIGNGRDVNQDAFFLKEADGRKGKMILAAVCDGMGGLKRGEVASQSMIDALDHWFECQLPKLLSVQCSMKKIQRDLIELIEKTNRRLLLLGKKYGGSMGTTLTMLFVMGRHFIILNIGDTRAYLFDNSTKFVTSDQTLVNEEVKAGRMTREEASKDKRRHILMQCIGVTRDISVDCYQGRIKPGMEILICSDGFYDKLREDEIYQVEPTREAMKRWISDCFQKVKSRGELDNLSCLLIKVKE